MEIMNEIGREDNMSVRKTIKSIKLVSLTLENWAQYNKETIEFNTEDKSGNIPVTFFLGENGVGKTKIFEAIRVCLFSDKDSSIEIDEYSSIDENIFAKYPLVEKSRIYTSITNDKKIQTKPMRIVLTLEVITNNDIKERIKIDRSWLFNDFECIEDTSIIQDEESTLINIKSNNVERFLEIKKQESGSTSWKNIDERLFEIELKDWIPEPVKDFFFFDGEKLTNIMSNPKKGKIREQALMKSDWFPIETLIVTSLNDLGSGFADDQTQTVHRDKKFKEAEEKKEHFKNMYNALNGEIDAINVKIKDLENEIKTEEDEFETKHNFKLNKKTIGVEYEKYQQLKKLKVIENERDSHYNEIGELLGNNTLKIYNFELLLISSIINEVKADLIEKKRKGIIPTKLDKSTFEYLIDRKKLLCEDCIDKMKNEQMNVIDEILNEQAKIFLNDLIKLEGNFPTVRKKLKEKYDLFKTIGDEIYLMGDPKSEINEDVLMEYISLTQKIDDIKDIIHDQNIALDEKEGELEIVKKEKNKWEGRYRTRKARLGKIEKSDLGYFVSNLLLELFITINENLDRNISNFIKKVTTKTFLDLIAEPESYVGVVINKDWRFGFVTQKQPKIPVYEPSKGQFHVIGLSFLHSLSGITKNELPIIFDTPFGRLGKKPKINIGTTIGKIFKGTQVILFLTDEEANNMLHYISDKSGYLITNTNKIEASIDPIDNTQLLEIIQTMSKGDN